jgi:hypothetical protein
VNHFLDMLTHLFSLLFLPDQAYGAECAAVIRLHFRALTRANGNGGGGGGGGGAGGGAGGRGRDGGKGGGKSGGGRVR